MNEQNKDTVTLPRDLWEKARAILKYVTENGLPEQQPEAEDPRKPTLDDYTSIRTYEDACEALGEAGITNGYIYKEFDSCPNPLPRHIVALLKLETISRALWGREWKPNSYGCVARWDFHAGKMMPNMMVYSIEYPYMPSVDVRLMQETQEKASYFGRQFIDLWAEYLGFDTEKREDEQ